MILGAAIFSKCLVNFDLVTVTLSRTESQLCTLQAGFEAFASLGARFLAPRF